MFVSLVFAGEPAYPSGVMPALIGALATIVAGVLALVGVRIATRMQSKNEENERKLSMFEEADRLIAQNRLEADRAYRERDAVAADRDNWRRRALIAEQKVDQWIERQK